MYMQYPNLLRASALRLWAIFWIWSLHVIPRQFGRCLKFDSELASGFWAAWSSYDSWVTTSSQVSLRWISSLVLICINLQSGIPIYFLSQMLLEICRSTNIFKLARTRTLVEIKSRPVHNACFFHADPVAVNGKTESMRTGILVALRGIKATQKNLLTHDIYLDIAIPRSIHQKLMASFSIRILYQELQDIHV